MTVQAAPRKGGVSIKALIPAIIMGIAFIAITISVVMGLGWVRAFDYGVEGAIISMRGDALSPVFRTISAIGGLKGLAVVGVVFLVILLVRKKWQAALFFVVAFGIAFAVCFAVKFGVGRPRPMEFLLDAELVETEPCFPSGHAWNCVMIFGLIAVITGVWTKNLGRRRGLYVLFLIIAIVFPIVVAFSRLYMGEHYPSDVCAGLLGAGFFVILFGSWYKRKFTTGPEQRTGYKGMPDYNPWQSFEARGGLFDEDDGSLTQVRPAQQPAQRPVQRPSSNDGSYVGRHAR